RRRGAGPRGRRPDGLSDGLALHGGRRRPGGRTGRGTGHRAGRSAARRGPRDGPQGRRAAAPGTEPVATGPTRPTGPAVPVPRPGGQRDVPGGGVERVVDRGPVDGDPRLELADEL